MIGILSEPENTNAKKPLTSSCSYDIICFRHLTNRPLFWYNEWSSVRGVPGKEFAMFVIGEKVVYPVHGAGIIEAIEKREILGKNT